MSSDVEKKIHTCDRCVRRKAMPERAAPLVNIRTTRPLELLCMDFLSLEPDSSNTKDILVLTDHFTKYAVAIPTPNQKAKTVARCLWNDFIVNFGIPERLHTDQGPDFESKLIQELCVVTGMKKTHTTPYHPRGNPVERFNRTLLNMLGTLERKQKTKWREYVKPLVHAYNCTRNEVTGFTPYELLFGRSPRLPVDLAFGLPVRDKSFKTHTQYVRDLRSRLEESYQLASKSASKSAERNKTRFDRRVTPCKLDVGDRVLVRNVRVRGKHKLEDRWAPDVYVVVKCAGDLPVYTVKPETREGPTRTLHRDLLLPCGFLPAQLQEDPLPVPARRPQTRSQSPIEPDLTYLSGDEDLPYFIPPRSFQSNTNALSEDGPELPAGLSPVQSPTECESQVDPLVPSQTRTTADSIPTSLSTPNQHPEPESDHSDPSQGSGSEVEDMTDAPVEGNGPESAAPIEDVVVEMPLDTVQPEEPSSQAEVPAPGQSDSSVASTSPDVAISPEIVDNVEMRRSTRDRRQPNRFQYSKLGNPLISVVQALFHSLSDVYTEALQRASRADVPLNFG